MRGIYLKCLPRRRIDPTVQNSTRRENKRVRFVLVKDGQFEIAVERRCRYRLPLHSPQYWKMSTLALIWIIRVLAS